MLVSWFRLHLNICLCTISPVFLQVLSAFLASLLSTSIVSLYQGAYFLLTRYAAVENGGACYCGDNYGSGEGLEELECRSVGCSGYTEQACGGQEAQAVYLTEIGDALTRTDIFVKSFVHLFIGLLFIYSFIHPFSYSFMQLFVLAFSICS